MDGEKQLQRREECWDDPYLGFWKLWSVSLLWKLDNWSQGIICVQSCISLVKEYSQIITVAVVVAVTYVNQLTLQSSCL